tara:strand:+ start:560 stop:1432 length:873 start_codon:yes stop_codon:yes gene_type:complete
MKVIFKGKVLITGLDGFTGTYVATALTNCAFECYGLNCNLLNSQGVIDRVLAVKPDYVLHLAGKSFAAEVDIASIYQSNVEGTLNLLDALVKLTLPPKKVILASSASVYGDSEYAPLNETMVPKPVSHYGCSKLSMEYMAEKYSDRLSLLMTRPFNYTGIGHSERFLIPKIIRAYKNRASTIELGNLDVFREFNDVRDVAIIYARLLISKKAIGTVNICSGRSVSLSQVIKHMDVIADTNIDVISLDKFIRKNEISHLSGATEKLQNMIRFNFEHSIESTLRWMYRSSVE